jgi:DNA-dependent RNA polymerase auxiliary subunit epsilon
MIIEINIKVGADCQLDVRSSFNDEDDAIEFIRRISYENAAQLDYITGGDHE